MPYECDGDSSSKDWRVAISTGAFRTTMELREDQEQAPTQNVDIEQASINATLGYQSSTRWGFGGTLGAILGGTVDFGTEAEVGQGFAVSLAANYLALFEKEYRPFVSTSLSLATSFTSPVGDDGMKHPWTAIDLRVGAMVGKTFYDRFVPYVAGRAFVGGVAWTLGGEEVFGNDKYQYTAGAGLVYQVPGTFSAFAELLPVGEKSMSVGGSLAF